MFIRNGQPLGSVCFGDIPKKPKRVAATVKEEAPTAGPPPASGTALWGKPKISASKADWVAFAESNGIDGAAELSKTELVELLGGE